MELKVIEYDPGSRIVTFEETGEYCIDTDCGARYITIYSKKIDELNYIEKQVFQEYLVARGILLK